MGNDKGTILNRLKYKFENGGLTSGFDRHGTGDTISGMKVQSQIDTSKGEMAVQLEQQLDRFRLGQMLTGLVGKGAEAYATAHTGNAATGKAVGENVGAMGNLLYNALGFGPDWSKIESPYAVGKGAEESSQAMIRNMLKDSTEDDFYNILSTGVDYGVKSFLDSSSLPDSTTTSDSTDNQMNSINDLILQRKKENLQ